MDNKKKLKKLRLEMSKLYKRRKSKLPFHNLHHNIFVRNKALEFARKIKADAFLVESSALVHDLNFLVKRNSEPKEGRKLREKILKKLFYMQAEINKIETIISESHTAVRSKNISKEGMALSDADSLFKILPITPVIFSGKFIEENRIDIKKLADKICGEQNKLLESGIYFYTNSAKKKYLDWAKLNLSLWNEIKKSLKDGDIQDLLASLDKK